ncbi:MAG: ImuA family protein [Hyphomonas sp.]
MDLAALISQGLIGPVTAPPAQAASFPYGLGTQGLHEVAEAGYGDRAAATGFILAAARPARKGVLLWISQITIARETGTLPEAALREMTGDGVRRLNLVTHQTRDALWAVEEAVVSGAVSHVIAEVDSADFTSTRRLTLASGRHGVPVTLLLPHRCEGATAASTRWRISPRPSAPNGYDPRAPGHPRWRAQLERCRTAPAMAGHLFDLEWNDETLSLTVVSRMGTGSSAPRQTSPYGTYGDRRTG